MLNYFKITFWAVIFSAFTVGTVWAQTDDETNGLVYSDHADPAMTAAIDSARKTLPKFWDIFESGDRDYQDFSIKVGLATTSGSFEHIWVNSLKYKKGKMSGKLANDPVDIPNVKFGDTIKFTVDEVTDWTYSKNGILYGHYTTRVLLKSMDPEMADYMKSLLSEKP